MIINKKGFSVVELVMYIGLVSILLSSIAIFSVKIIEIRERSFVINEVESQGNYIMNTIISAIRNADEINGPVTSTMSNTLSLEMINSTIDPTVFDLSQGFLQIKEGAGNAISLSNNSVVISDLFFNNLSADGGFGNIEIMFNVSTLNNAKTAYNYSKKFVGSASLRY